MAFVVDDKALSDVFDEVTRLDSPRTFPLVRLAIVTAVVSAAAPYVTRPTRRLGQFLVLALALSAMYLGTGYPSDILAALFLGWGVAALVHLVFGSPGGRPTAPRSPRPSRSSAWRRATCTWLRRSRRAGRCSSREDDQGPLWVRVIGRDEADSQFLAKLWRSLVYKDSGPQLYLTRAQDVEHEAYTLLLARAGRGPGSRGRRRRYRRSRRGADRRTHSSTAASSPISSADDVDRRSPRRSVASGAARCTTRSIAHGELNTRNVMVVDGRPVIMDFTRRRPAPTNVGAPADLAELLTSTAVLVGDDRAIAALSAGSGCRRPPRRDPDAAGAGADPHHPTDAGQAQGGGQATRRAAQRRGEGRRCRRPRARRAAPGQPDEPDDGDRHAGRRRGAARPGRQPPGDLGHGQERRVVARRRSRSCCRSRRTSRTRSRSWAACRSASRSGRRPRPRSRCRSATSRSPRSAGSRSRSGSCRSAASTSRPRSAAGGLLSTVAQRGVPDPAVRHRGRALADHGRHRTDRHRVGRSRSCSSRSS